MKTSVLLEKVVARRANDGGFWFTNSGESWYTSAGLVVLV
jgi:hypothetical protein